MLLLHGEENLERFRSETACAVYQLPWLSPRDAMNYSGELTELVPLFEKPLQSLHEALVPRQSRQRKGKVGSIAKGIEETLQNWWWGLT
jgi:hypothetical protein